MQISVSDAITLFRKWRDEKRAMMCVLKGPYALSYTLGQISDVTNGVVTVDQKNSRLRELGDAISAVVSVNNADDYDYVEGRHTAPQFSKLQAYDALLTLTFGKSEAPVFSVGFAVLPDWEQLLKN